MEAKDLYDQTKEGLDGIFHHPDFGYISTKELIEKGVNVFSGLTNQGDRITSWEHKMYDGRTYIANHLMKEGTVFLLNNIPPFKTPQIENP